MSGYVLRGATSPANSLATIVYLKNLAAPRVGHESDDAIVDDLVKDGYLVLVLDYAHDPKSISPDLAADLLKLRQDIADAKKKNFLTEYPIDPNQLFILPSGCRIKRNVEFARDGERVLGMDIIYPSKPAKPVPALMEITCDNKDRFGSFSLLFCHDTLVEGGAVAGFASAMIDHPVPPPYKGLDDPMPQVIERDKAAAAKLRSLAGELNLNGKIGVMGFSRGGPMAAILAAPGKSDVQAALVHGNRYDYLDLLPNDPMLARFEKAWGKRDDNKDRWASHGAIAYLRKDAAPMFLNTSAAESPEYRDGLAKLDKKLTELGVEHAYQVDDDKRGHQVTTQPKTLAAIYAFFAAHLQSN